MRRRNIMICMLTMGMPLGVGRAAPGIGPEDGSRPAPYDPEASASPALMGGIADEATPFPNRPGEDRTPIGPRSINELPLSTCLEGNPVASLESDARADRMGAAVFRQDRLRLDDPPPGGWCGTHEQNEAALRALAGKRSRSDTCPLFGTCDEPAARDAAIPNENTPVKVVRVMVHVFCLDDGTSCATTSATVDGRMAALNTAFEPYRFQFTHDTAFHHDSVYRSIAWDDETATSAMKLAYASSPGAQLNIYVVDMAGVSLAWLPFAQVATAALGGSIMDEDHFNYFTNVFAHEIGHVLGLFHTHHGHEYSPPCGPCYEFAGVPDQDIEGDRCSDTPPTPLNFLCYLPGGTDPCNGVSWGTTDYTNYMEGGTGVCHDHFTSQQSGRMHCWTEDVLSCWYRVAEEGDEDCNQNGIPDECEPDADCNGNTVTDICDISSGTSPDCQSDLIPDECQLSASCITQAVDFDLSGEYSDIDCDACTGGPVQVIADQFSLGAAEEISSVVFWGFYLDDEGPLAENELITVVIRDHQSGVELPGAVIRTVTGPPRSREISYLYYQVVYRYTVDLVPGAALSPGQYWLEIYADTTGDPVSWAWFQTDAPLSAGIAFSYDMPESWLASANDDMAFQLLCAGHNDALPSGGDDIPDDCQADCNGNGIPDATDLAGATSDDCDANSVPDECQADTDGDGAIDACDVDDDNDGVNDDDDYVPHWPGLCGDSDGDTCDDCAVGTDGFGPMPDNDPTNDGPDNDGDGWCNAGDNCPDHSNPGQEDCDADDTGDVCTLAECAGDPACGDCNSNSVPDGCDLSDCPAEDPSCQDCNANGVLDECDISGATSPDSNGNGIPDDCEIHPAGTAAYPDNRARNRYIAFDPNKAENDGVNVAFKATLTSLSLRSCDNSGSPDVEGWPCRTDDDCRACAVDENACWTAPLHCRATEPPEPPNSCDLTGAACVNDQAGSVGMSWWVGPKHATEPVHLMVTEPYRLVSPTWPDPVSVADCEIVPVATYEVVAVNVDTDAESDPLAVSTAARPDKYWADCVGSLGMFCTGNWAPCGDAVCPQPPTTNVCDLEAQMCDDGFTPCGDAACPPGNSCLEQWPPPDHYINFQDVTAAVFTFQQMPGLTVSDVENLDLHGAGGGDPNEDPPNYVVNFADIADTVSAFQGYPYKYSDPGDCPDVCDLLAYPDCAP